MSVLLIASEIFGTQGIEIVDVQLRSNGAWFLIQVFYTVDEAFWI